MAHTQTHTHRKWMLWLPLLLAAAGAAYLLFPGQQDAPSPAWNAAKVIRGNLVATVSATGTLNPLITVQVGSQVSGIIQSLEADFNTPVRAGDVIARIEPSLFKAKLAEAQANLKNAEALRDKAAIAIREKRRSLDRLKGLQERKLVSDSDLDTAQFALESAVVELREKEAAVAKADATLDHERFNLDNSIIRAPIDGVVISRNVDRGQTVAASLQAPTLFTIAQDLTRMQIETDVDEAFIGMVREGQPVNFSVFAYPDRAFSGELVQVRLEPKVDAGVVKYNCVIHVDNADLALKPGMTATVSIQVDRRTNILKVPNEALRFVPQLPARELGRLRRELVAGESMLWTEGASGLEPRKVQAGLVGEKETEIAGEDVSEGMSVAVPARKQDASGRYRGFSLF
ncbi:MAG TPA: efflux RND transporter periplasmic adaptor subunit [Gammaproteobacteria bacterium]|nr:efflux RND transporter periplasmic adaptor subunit [Gammaproteobacteria bacterium]